MAQPYADKTRVRKLSGGISIPTISNAELDDIILYSDDMVDSRTGKSDWSASDALYSLVTSASEYFAAARVRDMFADPDEISNEMYQTAIDICTTIINSVLAGGATNPGVISIGKPYATFPMNPNGEYYSSLRGGSFSSIDETSEI